MTEENEKRNIADLPKEALKIPLKTFNKLKSYILLKDEARANEIILYYIKIYTYLVNAYDFLNSQSYKRAFNYLDVLKNITQETVYRGEQQYVKIISDIVKEINSSQDEIIRRMQEYQASDPVHARTKLQLAQNICILRILKIS